MDNKEIKRKKVDYLLHLLAKKRQWGGESGLEIAFEEIHNYIIICIHLLLYSMLYFMAVKIHK